MSDFKTIDLSSITTPVVLELGERCWLEIEPLLEAANLASPENFAQAISSAALVFEKFYDAAHFRALPDSTKSSSTRWSLSGALAFDPHTHENLAPFLKTAFREGVFCHVMARATAHSQTALELVLGAMSHIKKTHSKNQGVFELAHLTLERFVMIASTAQSVTLRDTLVGFDDSPDCFYDNVVMCDGVFKKFGDTAQDTDGVLWPGGAQTQKTHQDLIKNARFPSTVFALTQGLDSCVGLLSGLQEVSAQEASTRASLFNFDAAFFAKSLGEIWDSLWQKLPDAMMAMEADPKTFYQNTQNWKQWFELLSQSAPALLKTSTLLAHQQLSKNPVFDPKEFSQKRLELAVRLLSPLYAAIWCETDKDPAQSKAPKTSDPKTNNEDEKEDYLAKILDDLYGDPIDKHFKSDVEKTIMTLVQSLRDQLVPPVWGGVKDVDFFADNLDCFDEMFHQKIQQSFPNFLEKILADEIKSAFNSISFYSNVKQMNPQRQKQVLSDPRSLWIHTAGPVQEKRINKMLGNWISVIEKNPQSVDKLDLLNIVRQSGDVLGPSQYKIWTEGNLGQFLLFTAMKKTDWALVENLAQHTHPDTINQVLKQVMRDTMKKSPSVIAALDHQLIHQSISRQDPDPSNPPALLGKKAAKSKPSKM